MISAARGISIFVVCALLAGTSFGKPTRTLKGTITKVSDGDTVHFECSEGTLKVRMLHIDAAESHLPTTNNGMVGQQPWGDDATNVLARLIPVGSKVTLEDHGTDKYKRTLGVVLKSKTDINLEMVAKGHASPYIICEGKTCDENFIENNRVVEYLEACASARNARLGIYNPRHPLKELPFEFRIRMQEREPEKFVGDIETMEYYEPEYYEEVDPCNRVFFMRESEAKRAGFTAARRR